MADATEPKMYSIWKKKGLYPAPLPVAKALKPGVDYKNMFLDKFKMYGTQENRNYLMN